MTEAESVFREDVREKSIIARSSRNTGSARRRGCGMGTDQLSRKAWEKMNGPVYSICLSKPITWAELKDFPQDAQRDYLQNIVTTYRVGPNAIARMLGISGPYCNEQLQKLGVKTGKRATPKDTARFTEEFLNAGADPKEPRAIAGGAGFVERLSLTFSGAFSPEAIAAKLAGFFGEGQDVTVTIEVAAR